LTPALRRATHLRVRHPHGVVDDGWAINDGTNRENKRGQTRSQPMAYENFQVSSSIAARMPGAKDLAGRAHWSFALRLVAHKGAPGGAPAAPPEWGGGKLRSSDHGKNRRNPVTGHMQVCLF
jgi:hypothetical protein